MSNGGEVWMAKEAKDAQCTQGTQACLLVLDEVRVFVHLE